LHSRDTCFAITFLAINDAAELAATHFVIFAGV
jgi:hypothetical protein